MDGRAKALRVFARLDRVTLGELSRRSRIPVDRVENVLNGRRPGSDVEFETMARRLGFRSIKAVERAYAKVQRALAEARP